MIRLILMRHGNTFEEGQKALQIGKKTDLALTDFGKIQAQKMAEFLESKKIFPKVIFSGALKRQEESAQIIAKKLNLKWMIHDALDEIDYGKWEGLSADEIRLHWPKEFEEWNVHSKWQSSIFQGTYEKHFNGIYHWMTDLLKKFDGETVLAVTSNGLLRFLRNEKVKTGHFCEIHLEADFLNIICWNQQVCETHAK